MTEIETLKAMVVDRDRMIVHLKTELADARVKLSSVRQIEVSCAVTSAQRLGMTEQELRATTIQDQTRRLAQIVVNQQLCNVLHRRVNHSLDEYIFTFAAADPRLWLREG